MIGDYLYELSARDQQLSWLDPLITRVTLSSNTVTVEPQYEVPSGKALLLRSVSIWGDAGTTQTVTSLFIELAHTTAGFETYLATIFSEQLTTATKNDIALNWSGLIVLPQNWIIRGTSNFDNGVNANTSSISLVGMLIPIGNIQRV